MLKIYRDVAFKHALSRRSGRFLHSRNSRAHSEIRLRAGWARVRVRNEASSSAYARKKAEGNPPKGPAAPSRLLRADCPQECLISDAHPCNANSQIQAQEWKPAYCVCVTFSDRAELSTPLFIMMPDPRTLTLPLLTLTDTVWLPLPPVAM